MRIVSLLPSATEILFDLGLGDDVVAVTDECDFPADATALPAVSRCVLASQDLSPREIDAVVTKAGRDGHELYEIDDALLNELAPDVIVTQDLCPVCALPQHQVTEALERSGCAADVISLDPHSIGDVLSSVTRVGDALGVSRRASEIVASLSARVEAVRTKTSHLDTRRVLALEWGDPPWGAGHWVPEMIEIAGGLPLLGEHRRDSRRVMWDDIRDAAPDVVAFIPCSFSLDEAIEHGRTLFDHDEFAATPAARNRRVWATDAKSYFSRSGPRLVDGLEILAAIVHPDAFDPPPPAAACVIG